MLNFMQFVKESWSHLHPDTEYIYGDHIEAICLHLDAIHKRWQWRAAPIVRGDHGNHSTRLAISLPPRHGLTTLVSVLYNPYVWMHDPEAKILTVGQDDPYVNRDLMESKRLMETDWYVERCRKPFSLTLVPGRHRALTNNYGGRRKACNILDPSFCGEGFDFILFDQVNQIANEAASRADRISELIDVYVSRLNDSSMSAMIVGGSRSQPLPYPASTEDTLETIMTSRTSARGALKHLLGSPADIFARLKIDECKHLVLDVERMDLVSRSDASIWLDKRNVGDILWPGRYGKPHVENLKKTLGTHLFNLNCQQRVSYAHESQEDHSVA